MRFTVLLSILTFVLGFGIGDLFEAQRPKPLSYPAAGFQVVDCNGLIAMGYTDSEGGLYLFSGSKPPLPADFDTMAAVPQDGRFTVIVPCIAPGAYPNNNPGEPNGPTTIQAKSRGTQNSHRG